MNIKEFFKKSKIIVKAYESFMGTKPVKLMLRQKHLGKMTPVGKSRYERRWGAYNEYYIDKKSIDTLKARSKIYSFFNSRQKFVKEIVRINKEEFRILELQKLYSQYNLVVMGKGDAYKYTLIMLNNSEWENKFRAIGNNKSRLSSIKQNELVVPVYGIDGTDNKEAVENLKKDYPDVNFYIPQYNMLVGTNGNQYFDVFAPGKNEIVIDGGACDGTTELDIVEWGGYCC